MEIKESKLKKWTGAYRGVAFEINNWQADYDKEDCWTYYLILHINRIPKEHKPNSYWIKGKMSRKHVIYDYYKHPVLSNIEWHYKITWYSKEHGFDGAEKIIKIGCDYRHYWDEGHYYNLDIVKYDVKKTIDSFLVHVPNYKYRCCRNGKLYDLKDGVIKNSKFYSREYYGDEMEEFKNIKSCELVELKDSWLTKLINKLKLWKK